LTRIIFALKYGAMKQIEFMVSIPKGGKAEALVRELANINSGGVTSERIGNELVAVHILGATTGNWMMMERALRPYTVTMTRI
jgi:hypothetical protein